MQGSCYIHDMSMLQIRNLPEEMKRALRRRAEALDMTMSDYVRELLEEDLSRPTADELLERLERLPSAPPGTCGADLLEEARQEIGG